MICSQNTSITVTALGQTLMTYDFQRLRPEQFNQCKSLFADSTFVITNMEPALGIPGIGSPTRPPDSPTHVMPISLLPQLQCLGINLLAAASNHSWDMGTASIIAGIQELEKCNFAYAGIGIDRQHSIRAGVAHKDGKTGAIISMATGKIRPGAAASDLHAGVNELRLFDADTLSDRDKEENLEEISRCKRSGYYTTVVHHNHEWMQDKRITPQWLINWAHACIDAGADLFLGHGAPLLQGIEIYRGRPILYNLGSFVFNCSSKEKWKEEVYWYTVAIKLQCASDGELLKMDILPILLDRKSDPHGFPTIANDQISQIILDDLADTSRRCFGTIISLSNKWRQNT
ncbi:MAG: hypothetical protein DBY39_00650 [Clostridiales bacterium]|nr:MAG: hypothetical protein DBY39_00650 [Clostridiales bacterium]